MIIIRLKFATPSEQYVDWGNNINLIFMMGQNSPPPLNYMLTGGSNINYISMRDQHTPPPIFMRDHNSPRPMNNMLIGVTTSTLSSYPPEVRRGATSGLQRTCWNGSIATIRGQIAMFVGKAPSNWEFLHSCQILKATKIFIQAPSCGWGLTRIKPKTKHIVDIYIHIYIYIYIWMLHKTCKNLWCPEYVPWHQAYFTIRRGRPWLPTAWNFYGFVQSGDTLKCCF